jgi:hypothetical protein
VIPDVTTAATATGLNLSRPTRGRPVIGVEMLRKLLLAGVALTLLVAGGTAAAGAWLWNRAALSTVGEVDFINPLAIPPLADSRRNLVA